MKQLSLIRDATQGRDYSALVDDIIEKYFFDEFSKFSLASLSSQGRMEEENNDQSYDSDESDDYNYMEPEYDVEGDRFCSDRLHPESFLYKAFERNEVEIFLNSTVDTLCNLINSHPSLRFCVGLSCPVLICALEEPKARRVQCERCHAEFCFMCSEAYHAPTSCATLKHWLVKCRDDSGTANYMTAHTKDCPSCHVCIEKNEGCNHMKCSICHYEFCWVCLGVWKSHDAEYYFCSKYQENPDSAKESVRTRARESLERYMFYYERWENHERSLRLEHDQRARIQTRINEKVLKKEGTWIDWQYLLLAADTLRNCRYTLKYTYPHAFYGEKLERKELFEYQQALLEAEVEDLSWKIEHAEITDRADLQNKMDICEKHRLTLLQEFLTN
ncbi:ariadne-2 [Schistosoma bovis]|uniref:RBR-type E3 ubiquitin transferase n=1 Tax=Schistosoma bovis TaxID=6184 RepID=A0A430QQU4_SCHBO|nr:ariadne-2 [Schistosoma bovis]